jgi:hypothetical protein
VRLCQSVIPNDDSAVMGCSKIRLPTPASSLENLFFSLQTSMI